MAECPRASHRSHALNQPVSSFSTADVASAGPGVASTAVRANPAAVRAAVADRGHAYARRRSGRVRRDGRDDAPAAAETLGVARAELHLAGDAAHLARLARRDRAREAAAHEARRAVLAAR